MRARRILLGIATALVVGCLAGMALAAGSGPTRLNLPGSADRPFSHVVVAGETIYVAGTLGLEPGTRQPPEDPRKEAALALDGIRAKLKLAGASMDDLVSVQVFCSDLELYDQFNEVYRGYFDEAFPARSFIGSGPLLFGSRFEINAVAVKQ